jgi:hypothetical protein
LAGSALPDRGGVFFADRAVLAFFAVPERFAVTESGLAFALEVLADLAFVTFFAVERAALRRRPLLFSRCVTSSGSASDNENVSGLELRGRDAITPS